MAKYYAVWGQNGAGVFTDFQRLETSKKFLRKSNCIKCATYEEARKKALNGFNTLNPRNAYAGPLSLNFIFYEVNMEEVRAQGMENDKYVSVSLCNGERQYLRKPFFKNKTN